MAAGTAWRPVGNSGWLREEGAWTISAWKRPVGWVWRCRNAYPAADRRFRQRDGHAASAAEARAAADAAFAQLTADGS